EGTCWVGEGMTDDVFSSTTAAADEKAAAIGMSGLVFNGGGRMVASAKNLSRLSIIATYSRSGEVGTSLPTDNSNALPVTIVPSTHTKAAASPLASLCSTCHLTTSANRRFKRVPTDGTNSPKNLA